MSCASLDNPLLPLTKGTSTLHRRIEVGVQARPLQQLDDCV